MPAFKKDLGDNVWLVGFNGYDGNGKRQRQQFRVKGQRKAERERQRLEREFAAGTLVFGDRSRLSELLDAWLAAAKETVAAKTYERYAEIVKLHIKPGIGATRLDRLQKNPEIIREFLVDRRHHGRRGNELSPRTVVHIHRALHAALIWACDDGKLATNPAGAASVRKLVRSYYKAAREGFEPTCFNAEQMSRLSEATRGTLLHLPVFLAASVGMRLGEIVALRWRDVDLATGVLEVRHSLSQTNDGVHEKPPKSKHGRRRFSLPAFAIRELQTARDHLGPEVDPAAYVCCNPDGSFIAPDALSAKFAAFIRQQEEFPKVRFHDLRHSNCTLQEREGIGMKTITRRTGHHSEAFTAEHYVHPLEEADRAAAAAIDRAFAPYLSQRAVNEGSRTARRGHLRVVK